MFLLLFSVTANIGALGLAAVRNSSSEAVALPKVFLRQVPNNGTSINQSFVIADYNFFLFNAL